MWVEVLCWIDRHGLPKNVRVVPVIPVSCVILHTMWSGKKEPAVAIYPGLWYVVFVCHQYGDCKNSVVSVYVGGYGCLSQSGLLCLP